MKICITVDVEDWFQSVLMSQRLPISEWSKNLIKCDKPFQEYLRNCSGLSSEKIAETIEVDFNRILGAKS